MNRHLLAFILFASCLTYSERIYAQPPGKEPAPTIGRIFIVGNTETPAQLIWALMPFRPGDPISAAAVRSGEARLRRVGLWVRPSVTVLNSDNADGQMDVLIQFQEGPWNWLLFSVGYEYALFHFTGDLERLNCAGLRVRDKIREQFDTP